MTDLSEQLEPLGTTGGPLSTIEKSHRLRLRAALSTLSLAEVQLLLLGLWVIGEENRVDPRLNTEYGWLTNSLTSQAQGTASHVINEQAPLPHPQPAKRQGKGRKA